MARRRGWLSGWLAEVNRIAFTRMCASHKNVSAVEIINNEIVKGTEARAQAKVIVQETAIARNDARIQVGHLPIFLKLNAPKIDFIFMFSSRKLIKSKH
jgi:hypothetical protein